jgi:hypothetical protein
MNANKRWARAAEGSQKKRRPVPSTPKILEQGNSYFNPEGAVRLARATARRSDTPPVGTPWIANRSGIKAYSTIARQGVLWGDGVRWDDSVLWCGGSFWDDNACKHSSILHKQPSWANGVLSSDGVLWGDHVPLKRSTMWQGKVGAHSLPGSTSRKWYPAVVDPTSMDRADADSVLIFGDVACSLRVGAPGAWFYPVH